MISHLVVKCNKQFDCVLMTFLVIFCGFQNLIVWHVQNISVWAWPRNSCLQVYFSYYYYSLNSWLIPNWMHTMTSFSVMDIFSAILNISKNPTFSTFPVCTKEVLTTSYWKIFDWPICFSYRYRASTNLTASMPK